MGLVVARYNIYGNSATDAKSLTGTFSKYANLHCLLILHRASVALSVPIIDYQLIIKSVAHGIALQFLMLRI